MSTHYQKDYSVAQDEENCYSEQDVKDCEPQSVEKKQRKPKCECIPCVEKRDKKKQCKKSESCDPCAQQAPQNPCCDQIRAAVSALSAYQNQFTGLFTRYEAALQLLLQALNLPPTNPNAAALQAQATAELNAVSQLLAQFLASLPCSSAPCSGMSGSGYTGYGAYGGDAYSAYGMSSYYGARQGCGCAEEKTDKCSKSGRSRSKKHCRGASKKQGSCQPCAAPWAPYSFSSSSSSSSMYGGCTPCGMYGGYGMSPAAMLLQQLQTAFGNIATALSALSTAITTQNAAGFTTALNNLNSNFSTLSGLVNGGANLQAFQQFAAALAAFSQQQYLFQNGLGGVTSAQLLTANTTLANASAALLNSFLNSLAQCVVDLSCMGAQTGAGCAPCATSNNACAGSYTYY